MLMPLLSDYVLMLRAGLLLHRLQLLLVLYFGLLHLCGSLLLYMCCFGSGGVDCLPCLVNDMRVGGCESDIKVLVEVILARVGLVMNIICVALHLYIHMQ